jgi:hypothetical protein
MPLDVEPIPKKTPSKSLRQKHGTACACNCNLAVGGQNVLNSTLNMTYENLLQQVNLAEQLTSSDFGVSTGLISQAYWEQSKWYFVNVERGNVADKL